MFEVVATFLRREFFQNATTRVPEFFDDAFIETQIVEDINRASIAPSRSSVLSFEDANSMGLKSGGYRGR